MATTNNSHLTAISRKTLPVPTRWLIKNGFIKRPYPEILDYGCGKCYFLNNEHFPCAGYDPHFWPVLVEKPFDIVICNYVLCTLPEAERVPVLKEIQKKLKKNGIAYISVRNDKPKQGWGTSKRGTYQGRVQGLNLPLLHKCSAFRIYTLTKQTKFV